MRTLGRTLFLRLALALAGDARREPLDLRVFTKVGRPGQPEPIAVGPDRRVYVGTNQLATATPRRRAGFAKQEKI